MIRILRISLVAFIATLFITSCEKELSEENGNLPGNNAGGGGNGGGGNGGGGNGGGNGGGGNSATCKSCTYQPWCDGSVYNYIDTMNGVATPMSQDVDILGDTTIDGKTYRKTLAGGSSTYTYHNCTGGVTSVVAYQATGVGGTTVDRINTTFLKENAAVGTTWTEINPGGGTGSNNNYEYEIIAKGISRTVLGTTFPDVIHVHQTLSVEVPFIGSIVMAETDYYFGKNVGLIESETTDGLLGTQIQHRVLQSYSIP